MKEKNQIKTKIGVGSVVKAKVGETEEKTREARVRRMNKEVVKICPGYGEEEQIPS